MWCDCRNGENVGVIGGLVSKWGVIGGMVSMCGLIGEIVSMWV